MRVADYYIIAVDRCYRIYYKVTNDNNHTNNDYHADGHIAIIFYVYLLIYFLFLYIMFIVLNIE